MRTAVIFGGVNQHHQVKALKAGVDILIATPGRLLDLCNQRHIRLDKVSILVVAAWFGCVLLGADDVPTVRLTPAAGFVGNIVVAVDFTDGTKIPSNW